MKNHSSKGKHKCRNHPHTKPAGRLKDKSSKILYIHDKKLRDTQKS